MLNVKNLSKKYGNHIAVDNINFQFKSGMIYGIIGANGAGKSTLLKLMSAFEIPCAGDVFLENKKLKHPSRSISIMWQKPYLFQTNVYNNIVYGLKARGINNSDIEERVVKIIEKFHLNDLKYKHSTELSGGESARVALARTLACGSSVILLDEPAANLDPPNTRLMEEKLKEVQRELGLTVIIVTHDMFQARRLADYTLYMEKGRITEANYTEKIFGEPKNKSTMRFLEGLL